MSWTKVVCERLELNLATVLQNGQSFRWKVVQAENGQRTEWIGIMRHRVWHLFQDSDSEFYFRVTARFTSKNSTTESENSDLAAVEDYFQLAKIDLRKLYKEWAAKDLVFRNLVFRTEDSKRKFQGIRILRQDPTECLFTFICSQNNNIRRISGMIERLCSKFGESLTMPDGQKFYDFPNIERLAASDVTDTLKSLGFGYRSAYVSGAAKKILEEFGGEDWLVGLRNQSYEEARNGLLTLPGVGPKVADCVCLMSLDKNDTVPVDTHVLQVTARNYQPHLKNVRLTPKVHKEIGDYFKEIFGEYAGWTQSVLFSSDLKQFSEKDSTNSRRDEKRSKKSFTTSPSPVRRGKV